MAETKNAKSKLGISKKYLFVDMKTALTFRQSYFLLDFDKRVRSQDPNNSYDAKTKCFFYGYVEPYSNLSTTQNYKMTPSL